MKPVITTTIPVRNGEKFILQTLESLARQTRKPDRVIVLDNWSTDGTQKLVEEFKGLKVEFSRNASNLGAFGNFNRCLDFAGETEYLHLLHADDCVQPTFYEVMTGHLADCQGRGMAWCLDERIDDNNKQLSISGKTDGKVEVIELDTFLAQKAEIGNQAFCATLLKTNYQPTPDRFPMDMPILGDMVFWPLFGVHCKKIVHVNLALAQYRWHRTNETTVCAPELNALIRDQWRTMQRVEALRKNPPGLVRMMKLKGLMSVRAGINAMRFKQLGKVEYSRDIVKMARGYTGLPLWFAGQCLVQTRELLVFKLGGRPRHPENIFS